jgi:hypothetical protein
MAVLVAAGFILCRQKAARQAHIISAARWPWIVIFIGFPAMLICTTILVLILESFPAHAWRLRTHHTILRTFDASTGGAIPMQIYSPPQPEDPYAVWSMSSSDFKQVWITWNVPTQLEVTSSGYELKPISLDAALPTQTRISLSRTTIRPATRPDWDCFGP